MKEKNYFSPGRGGSRGVIWAIATSGPRSPRMQRHSKTGCYMFKCSYPAVIQSFPLTSTCKNTYVRRWRHRSSTSRHTDATVRWRFGSSAPRITPRALSAERRKRANAPRCWWRGVPVTQQETSEFTRERRRAAKKWPDQGAVPDHVTQFFLLRIRKLAANRWLEQST